MAQKFHAKKDDKTIENDKACVSPRMQVMRSIRQKDGISITCSSNWKDGRSPGQGGYEIREIPQAASLARLIIDTYSKRCRGSRRVGIHYCTGRDWWSRCVEF